MSHKVQPTSQQPNLLTMSFIGANLLLIAPIAFSIWFYSQFIPASNNH